MKPNPEYSPCNACVLRDACSTRLGSRPRQKDLEACRAQHEVTYGVLSAMVVGHMLQSEARPRSLSWQVAIASLAQAAQRQGQSWPEADAIAAHAPRVLEAYEQRMGQAALEQMNFGTLPQRLPETS